MITDEETPLASKLIRLREKGEISDKVLLLYGISGEMPQRSTITTPQEKEEARQLFLTRIVARFGKRWRRFFKEIPTWLWEDETALNEWLKEGF